MELTKELLEDFLNLFFTKVGFYKSETELYENFLEAFDERNWNRYLFWLNQDGKSFNCIFLPFETQIWYDTIWFCFNSIEEFIPNFKGLVKYATWVTEKFILNN